MSHIKLIVLFLLFPVQIFSQIFQESYFTGNDSLRLEKHLNLHITGATFFNNNEYFNPYQEGYTLIGGFLQPELVYSVNKKLSLTAGLHIKKYYGNEGFADAEPMFSICYRASDALNIVMGSFGGGQNHLLPETMLEFENHFSNLVENGILLTLDKNFLKSRLWLDWEKFIEPGDPFNEEFTAGITNVLKIFNAGKFSMEIPLYVLAHHSGGQININNAGVSTYYNFAEGVRLFKPAHDDIRGIYPFAELLIHQSTGDYSVGTGYAVQFTGGVKTRSFELNGGYFHGDDFASFYGHPLFHSYTDDQSPGIIPGGSNDVITFKAGYRAKLSTTSFLFLRFEGYYNPGIKKFDYTYGLHMQVNEFIKIKKF